MGFPLISCITPTYNRREFFPRSVRCFLSQDYLNLEWVIVDNGTDPIKDLLPEDPRIKYFPLPGEKLNHGQLMNICCERALGEYFIVVDDDDWYPPNRVSRQIAPLLANPAVVISGTSTLFYYEHGAEKAYRYTVPHGVQWLASIAFKKSAWEKQPFEALNSGADTRFQRKLPAGTRHHDLNDPALVVAAIHPNNACQKPTLNREYRPEPWETIKKIVGELCL